MNEEAKIKAGILFSPADPQLKAMKLRAHRLNLDYNRLYEDEVEAREAIIHQIVGHIGEGSFFQGPVTFHYGVHTSVGKRCFFNFNLTVQDDAAVTIGDDCNFGPNVTIVTPIHPMVAAERREMLNSEGQRVRLCYARPVTIGNDCWLGAGVIVCPGSHHWRWLRHRRRQRGDQGYSRQLFCLWCALPRSAPHHRGRQYGASAPYPRR